MRWWRKREAAACPFCALAQGLPASSTSSLLFQDEEIVAFEDINPSAFRHYLVIPKEHIRTVNDLRQGEEHHALVQHMLKTGETLMRRDAPAAAEYRFGFHRPPFNSVNHLHLHCMALPYHSRWRAFKYLSLGRWGGYISADDILKRLHLASSALA